MDDVGDPLVPPCVADGQRPMDQHSKPMGDPWNSTINPWATHGRPMGQPSKVTGDPWETHTRPLGQPFTPTGDPWETHGGSMARWASYS